jgi:anti-sigma regulatory factor (Ser/Thr protein kinase)
MGVDPGSPTASPVLTLDPLAQAVATARRFVREALPSLDGADMTENAELVVSELVTNATLHARTSMTITVARMPSGRVRISVRDHSTVVPQPRVYALTATTGRGLRLVDAVSIAWGVDRVPPEHGAGKILWCEPAPDTSAVEANDEWGDVIAELA